MSDEVKPGYAGHVPAARDTCGTSHFRDGFTHRTGKARVRDTEDGALSDRTTSARRVFTYRDPKLHPEVLAEQGYHPGRSKQNVRYDDGSKNDGLKVHAPTCIHTRTQSEPFSSSHQ